MKRATIVLLMLLTGSAAGCAAQQVRGAEPCRGVLTSTLASGRQHPRFGECAPHLSGELAAAIREARTRTDPDYLNTLWIYGASFRDAPVFDAAMDVARDPNATAGARVMALAVLSAQIDNRVLVGGLASPEQRFAVPLGRECRISVLEDAGPQTYLVNRALPTRALDDLLEIAAAMTREPSAEPVSRDYAACVGSSLRAARASDP